MPDKAVLATTEIVNVMRKYDLAGSFIIVEPDHIHHYTKLDASWSCATYDGEEARFKALLADFPNQEAQIKCINRTAGMLLGMIDVLRILKEQFELCAQTMGKKFAISHSTREIKPPGL